MTEREVRNSFMELNEIYFWTSTITDWKYLLKQDKYKQVIVDSFKVLFDRELVKIYGFVIMPNHIHVIWTMLAFNQKELPDSSFLSLQHMSLKKI